MQLNQESLGRIDSVPVPAYPRTRDHWGIVHLGVGGFHRAHQALYVDRLMRRAGDGALDWAICGVGVMPADARMRDALGPQDGLYTLTQRHPDFTAETRVVGSVVDYLYAPDDAERVVERLAAPQTRIVSLTVTEGGYNFSPTTGTFDDNDPAVLADLAAGAVPATTFGLVTEALRRRRDRGLGPFTVMSCDNVQGNGERARASFTGFARLKDPDLAGWIEEHTRFPSSMVDRITPATSPDLAPDVERRTGILDRWPVVTEPFTQWVLEDSFNQGRPALEEVGVQLVGSVEPYERMKLRLLNGSHQALAYFGHLLGHRQVHEAAGDPLLRELVSVYMDREAEPTLGPVPGVDLADYKRTLLERFTNAAIADTVPRLCAEASDRIPRWLVPVIRDQLDAGRQVWASAAVVASWTRYAEGTDEQGRPITIVDRLAGRLTALAEESRQRPLAFLEQPDLFGDLAHDPRFTEPYLHTLASLRGRGARATLAELAGR